MFGLFKKSASNNVVITEPEEKKEKTMNEWVEEIHETFYTEVDRLLSDAKIANSLDTDRQDLIAKCERLKALGFTATKEVKEAESEIKRLENLKLENETKKTLIGAINYFSRKYPTYKFITEASVLKICKKYNLVYGPIDKYIGTVPDKNLKEMENFKIHPEDECYFEQDFWVDIIRGRFPRGPIKYYTKKDFEEMEKKEGEMNQSEIFQKMMMNTSTMRGVCPLEIAAPQRDFNMEGSEIRNFKIEILDPVVLKPVIYEGKKYYLIVTAWGLEAGDDLVVNANHN